MDSAILLRAVSIVLIVLGHITPYEVSGSVAVLFMLAGWSFADFQLRAVLQRQNVTPILVWMAKLAVPTVLAIAWQNWGHFIERWWAFLMLSNYFPVSPYRVAGFWFIDVLLQIFVILAILFSIPAVRRAAARPFLFTTAATVGAMGVGMAIHLAWNTKPIYDYVPHMFLWIVCYGMAMRHAEMRWQKLALTALLLAGSIAHHIPVFSLVAAIGILFVRRIPLPAAVIPVFTAIAASSLYIYVTHDKMGALLYGKLLGAHVTYESLGALQFHSVTSLRGVTLSAVLVAVGVLIGMTYNWFYTRVLRAIRRRSADEVLDASRDI